VSLGSFRLILTQCLPPSVKRTLAIVRLCTLWVDRKDRGSILDKVNGG